MEYERLDQFDLDRHKFLSLQVIQEWPLAATDLGKTATNQGVKRLSERRASSYSTQPQRLADAKTTCPSPNSSNSKGIQPPNEEHSITLS
jgi:hypothetical protein